MGKVAKETLTEGRKIDHIRINLEENVQFPTLTTGFENYYFMHQAVPELSLAEIAIETEFLSKSLAAPILISSMTGGTKQAHMINRNLAIAAQHYGIAMGLGSQRAALENAQLEYSFKVRDFAPDILLFANIGAVQLNYGYGLDECRRAVAMVEADALILHLNVLQEAVQPEGDSNFGQLLEKIEAVCKTVEVPVIAKEVGWGLSEQAARQLTDAGVAVLDVAGAGGTSWSTVEYHRATTKFNADIAKSFADWGIPTVHSLIYARRAAPNMPLIASGGLKNGIDIAKSIALGANLGGLAGPFLKAAVQSEEIVIEAIEILAQQLKIAMLCAGVPDIKTLGKTTLYSSADWPTQNR
ncbi:type 2 isopentenyl-diphosphate Delta-isomerase [Chloroflexota bacterium]